MAIDCVDEVLKLKGAPIYVFHEIVHNRHVVESFEARGVKFVDDISEVPANGTIVYSAHGISPEVRRQSRALHLVEIDATCPLVTKVHLEVLRFAREGYCIIFVGHRNHDEAIGTVGEAPAAIRVVESPEEVASLVIPNENRVAYVTQTTLSVLDAQRIIDALKRRFPNIKAPPKDDICYATTNRQNAVSQLSPEVDMVLVIGSKNSSNSKRLTEISENVGCPAHLIDDVSELRTEWFGGVEAVMVTAGASAPEDLVAELCRELVTRFGATIEVRNIVEEDTEFKLPAAMGTMMKAQGIDPASRRIRVSSPVISEEVYGAVPLTVGATG